jgi:hypothetical protein
MYGDDDPAIVAGGHSHVACLIGAHDAGLGPKDLHAAVAFSADMGPLAEGYWDYLCDAGAGRTVALVWEGNQHNVAFLLQPDPSFRVFCAPGDPRPREEPGTWVPREMVSGYWEDSLALLGLMLDRLAERSEVLVIGTPPPKPDADLQAQLQGKLEWDPWMRELASARGEAGSDLQISSGTLRLALWSVIQDGMREVARRSGATFVPVPESVRDGAGFLADAYCAPDLTHANAAYGGLIWAQIEAASAAERER